MPYNFNHLKEKSNEVIEWLKKELGGVRSNRATPSILDTVYFEAYGAKARIDQSASVTSEDPRTLRISPWDESQIKPIEKAIVQANLGLSVMVDDKGIRVVFPELTAERRQALLKVAKEKLEDAKTTLRGIRDDVWKDIQAKEKEGGMGEDEKFRYKNEMQKMIDVSTKSLDEFFGKKEKEILS